MNRIKKFCNALYRPPLDRSSFKLKKMSERNNQKFIISKRQLSDLRAEQVSETFRFTENYVRYLFYLTAIVGNFFNIIVARQVLKQSECNRLLKKLDSNSS